jgi:hypothetical protein
MAALILPLISNKNGAVYDSTVGVISRLLQSDVAKAGDPQRASEILVRVVKREHLPRVHRITQMAKLDNFMLIAESDYYKQIIRFPGLPHRCEIKGNQTKGIK